MAAQYGTAEQRKDIFEICSDNLSRQRIASLECTVVNMEIFNMEINTYDAALCSNCGQCVRKADDPKEKQGETALLGEERDEGFPRDAIGDMLDDLFY